MFANVPRIITSWLPRREPYELKSRGSTPCSIRYRPAGVDGGIEPAGEMWSVVTESPSMASTRAPTTSAGGSGSGCRPSKYGGSRTYVESSSQANRAPVGAAIARQRSSPSQTRAYSVSYISASMEEAIRSRTSSAVGQMSRR